MKKIYAYLLCSLFFAQILKAQFKDFSLHGRIPGVHLTSLEIQPSLVPIWKLDTILIYGDSFVVKGNLLNPYIFYLFIKTDSITRMSNSFVIEPGNHDLQIQFNDSVFSMKHISNSLLYDEYLNHFLPFFHQKEFHTLPNNEVLEQTKRYFEDNLYGLNTEVLSEYLQLHPKSYVAFLILYRKFIFSRADHNAEYLKAFTSADSSLRISAIGKEFSHLLQAESFLLVGKKFPQFELKDFNSKSATFNYSGDSLILVDYWSTWCVPCVRQIPILATLYNKYGPKKLSIISISVDYTKDMLKMKKFVDSLQMNWVHYWDENGKIAQDHKITLYPTYFLLNGNGEIIARSNLLKPIQEMIEKKLE